MDSMSDLVLALSLLNTTLFVLAITFSLTTGMGVFTRDACNVVENILSALRARRDMLADEEYEDNMYKIFLNRRFLIGKIFFSVVITLACLSVTFGVIGLYNDDVIASQVSVFTWGMMAAFVNGYFLAQFIVRQMMHTLATMTDKTFDAVWV
jgi:hypothetical protein